MHLSSSLGQSSRNSENMPQIMKRVAIIRTTKYEIRETPTNNGRERRQARTHTFHENGFKREKGTCSIADIE